VQNFLKVKKDFALSLNSFGLALYGKVEKQKYNFDLQENKFSNFSIVLPEPWGYVVTEAFLSGRLVIASDVCGIPEQVKNCKGVLLIEPGNAEKLKESIVTVHAFSRETILEIDCQNRETFKKFFK